MRKESHIRPLYLDLFCLALVIALNPVSHFITLTPDLFTADTIAYATMAKELFTKGLLYIPSWGHIDTGLMLPPLYPFLIASGRIFSPETLNVAEYVSSICALMSSVIILLYLKKMTNRIIAIITTVLIQVNYYYFLIGMSPLLESAFLLFLSLAFYLMLLMLNNPDRVKKLTAFLAGLVCCLVFLARQIGIILSIFAVVMFFIQWLSVYGVENKIFKKNIVFMLLGWLLLFAPYTALLYYQTDQHPFTQSFREYKYTVAVKDPEILRQIEENRTLPSGLIRQIESGPDSDYGLIYAERRRMRKLLPDSSEMFSYINTAIEENSLIAKTLSNIIDLKHYPLKCFHNILHLSSSLGIITTVLFFLACFSSLLIRNHRIRLTARVLLTFFIIFYFIIISSLTDKIDRYIYILFPFCLMHIAIELYICINALTGLFRPKRFPGLIFYAVMFSLIIFTTPRFFTGLSIIPKAEQIENRHLFFKEYLNGEPVFSLIPYYCFIAGGSFRILPDDSLDKVAKYGKKTGVRWLLIIRTPSTTDELKLYSNAQWYFNSSLESSYPDLVKFRVGTSDGVMALYEIL
jgi:4-amino-4-deoxy-L-arabinose transferase-like glycosyltransferase